MPFLINGYDRLVNTAIAPAIVYIYDGLSEDNFQKVNKNINLILEKYKNLYEEKIKYFNIFCWQSDNSLMLDIWKFYENHEDNSSGYLADCDVYKETEIFK